MNSDLTSVTSPLRALRTNRGLRLAGVASLAAALALSACGDDAGGSGDKPIVGLITKTDTNPFFVKMKEGAQKAADEQNLELQTFAGKQDGDNEAQVQAIE